MGNSKRLLKLQLLALQLQASVLVMFVDVWMKVSTSGPPINGEYLQRFMMWKKVDLVLLPYETGNTHTHTDA